MAESQTGFNTGCGQGGITEDPSHVTPPPNTDTSPIQGSASDCASQKTPPQLLWTMPLDHEVHVMRYDEKRRVLWLRAEGEETGTILKVDPWGQHSPQRQTSRLPPVTWATSRPEPDPYYPHPGDDELNYGLDIDTRSDILLISRNCRLQLINPDTMTEKANWTYTTKKKKQVAVYSVAYHPTTDSYLVGDYSCKLWVLEAVTLVPISGHDYRHPKPHGLRTSNNVTTLSDVITDDVTTADDVANISDVTTTDDVTTTGEVTKTDDVFDNDDVNTADDVHRHDDVIILGDTGRACVHVFDIERGFDQRAQCKPGEGDIGAADSPEGFCVDPRGQVYVCDTGNDRVVSCGPPGLYDSEADTWEVVLSRAHLHANQPYRVEVTGLGYMFVAFRKPALLAFYNNKPHLQQGEPQPC